MRNWMKQARDERNLTMREVSDQLNISESYYCLIENDIRQKRLDMALASKLSSIFGLSLETIIKLEEARKEVSA